MYIVLLHWLFDIKIVAIVLFFYSWIAYKNGIWRSQPHRPKVLISNYSKVVYWTVGTECGSKCAYGYAYPMHRTSVTWKIRSKWRKGEKIQKVCVQKNNTLCSETSFSILTLNKYYYLNTPHIYHRYGCMLYHSIW